MLLNLISNAYQAMPEGGRLTFDAWVDKQYVYLSIADTGTGISPENMDNIFEPLFTMKTSSYEHGKKSLLSPWSESIQIFPVETLSYLCIFGIS